MFPVPSLMLMPGSQGRRRAETRTQPAMGSSPCLSLSGGPNETVHKPLKHSSVGNLPLSARQGLAEPTPTILIPSVQGMEVWALCFAKDYQPSNLRGHYHGYSGQCQGIEIWSLPNEMSNPLCSLHHCT